MNTPNIPSDTEFSENQRLSFTFYVPNGDFMELILYIDFIETLIDDTPLRKFRLYFGANGNTHLRLEKLDGSGEAEVLCNATITFEPQTWIVYSCDNKVRVTKIENGVETPMATSVMDVDWSVISNVHGYHQGINDPVPITSYGIAEWDCHPAPEPEPTLEPAPEATPEPVFVPVLIIKKRNGLIWLMLSLLSLSSLMAISGFVICKISKKSRAHLS
jgi:hypothetical protein